MNNFTYHNPVKVVFGKGSISKLPKLIDSTQTVGLFYGGGSIKKNGVYDQIRKALTGYKVVEFGGIEPNPEYETCLKGIDFIKKNSIDFLLAAGGGSVLDAVKFMSGAVNSEESDLWSIVEKNIQPEKPLPLGCILTLPATGSEMNGNTVISRREKQLKLPISSPSYYPKFSILDPETTFSLSWRQTGNGIVDAFVHVAEQYLTSDMNTPLQSRQAEAIIKTLVELADNIKNNENDYDTRANIMWCATNALNGLISAGAHEDWATHNIGHQLTAYYGMDHAASLAVVLPGLLSFQRKLKEEKLLQLGERVWGISQGDKNVRIDEVIGRITLFFEKLDVHTRFRDYDINGKEAAKKVYDYFHENGKKMGEDGSLGAEEINSILLNRI